MTKPTDEYRRILRDLGLDMPDETVDDIFGGIDDLEDDPFNLDFMNEDVNASKTSSGSFAEIFNDGFQYDYKNQHKANKSPTNEEKAKNINNKIDQIIEKLDYFFDGGISAYAAIDDLYSDIVTLKTYVKLNPISAGGDPSALNAANAEIRLLKQKLGEKERESHKQKMEFQRESESLRSRLNAETKELRERLAYYEKVRQPTGNKRKVVRLDHLEDN